MKFKYSKFQGFDVFSINLGELMDNMSDALLDSGYDDDYYWTREQKQTDTSLDALRRALLQALINQGLVDEQQIASMLAQNEGKFRGSLLEELLNQLIERLVEEGYLTLREEQPQRAERQRGRSGPGEVSEPLPRDVHFEVTEKGLDFLGYKTLRNLLGSFGKSAAGRHDTVYLSTGVEAAAASKRYEFGDTINLDVSHSMILYGEDRFTPAKKVALAMSHLIRTQYPGDSLKVVLFHDAAEELPLAKLATTQVGPYHTNTAEGLRLARRLLQAQRKEMKQIVMVTDGKPTACFVQTSQRPGDSTRRLYKNSMGGDPFVMAETFKEVQACRKAGIMINTFMLASDYYLVDFVKQMSAMTNGKAYFANPGNLSQFVLIDFLRRRTRRVR
jgi:Ca-activated chloride channel family protein